MSWRWVSAAQTLAGLLLLAAAVLLNPWVVTMLAADGVLSQPTRIVLVELFLAAMGVYALWRAALTRKHQTSVPRVRVLAAATALAMGLLVALLMGEIAVRLAIDPLAILTGDAWWEYRWRQADARGDTGASTPYRFEEFDEMRGWRVRAGFRSDSVQTNGMGLRAFREYTLTPPPGLRRVVLVGDSFTWGEEVRNEETFAHLLENRLNSTDVINMGVRGYGTDQQLIFFRELGLRLQPDVVVLGLFEENVNRNILTFRDYAKPRFVSRDGDLSVLNTPVPDPESVRARKQDLPASMLAAFVSVRWKDIVDRTVFRTPNSEREETVLSLAILDAMKRDAEKTGARFVLMFIPWSNFDSVKPLRDITAGWAERTGTAYLDLAAEFRVMPADQKARLYIPGGHWTPFGHAVVASLLEKQLLESASDGSL